VGAAASARLPGAGLDRGQRHRVDDVLHQGPRLRSLTGLARPCNIGPTLTTCPLRGCLVQPAQEKLTLARVYAAFSPSNRASPVLNRKINDLILPACHDLSLRETSG
jgi:hypothetical protein